VRSNSRVPQVTPLLLLLEHAAAALLCLATLLHARHAPNSPPMAKPVGSTARHSSKWEQVLSRRVTVGGT
jgi:hypothetical protein